MTSFSDQPTAKNGNFYKIKIFIKAWHLIVLYMKNSDYDDLLISNRLTNYKKGILMKKFILVILLLTISVLSFAQADSVSVNCKPIVGPMGGSIVTLKGDLDLTDLDTGAKQVKGELTLIISNAMDGVILSQTSEFVGQYDDVSGPYAIVGTEIDGELVSAYINFYDEKLSYVEYKGQPYRINCVNK